MNIASIHTFCSFCADRVTDVTNVGSKVGLWDYLKSTHLPYDSNDVAEAVAGQTYIFDYSIAAFIICSAILGVFFVISRLLVHLKIDKTFLKFLFITAWVLSFVVYDVGMYTGQYISLLTNAPMAIIHAFESFLLGSDVSAIHEPFHNSWLFMSFFSFSHALSAFASTLFLIKIFRFNIKQKLRLYYERKKSAKAITYVLWGVNDITYMMAESIANHHQEIAKREDKKPSYRIIVIKTPGESCDTETTPLGFNKIFEIISLKDSELQQLQEKGYFIVNASNINMNTLSEYSANSTKTAHDILGGEMKLKTLAKILLKRTTDEIHFLLLSDDEKQNLHDVSVLLNDTTLNDFTNKKKGKVVMYCHARYNGVHRVIEDRHCSSSKIEVRLIDSSHINVEMLKENHSLLPVQYVDVEPDATVSSPFNAMVVGFSEVGQDTTRFLYEFGAFVKSGNDIDHPVRSEFHLDVIDSQMADKAGSFVANAPAIKPSMSFYPGLKNPDALIELHNMDCRSVAFYNFLEDKIKTLNYIVVATEDDELNMTLGVRIFRAATRYRANMKNLCILIRIHNDEDGHFAGIASYYNRLWSAQEAVFKTVENMPECKEKQDLLKNILAGKVKNEVVKDDDDTCVLPLYIFGQDKAVYTYQNIIDNRILKEAVDFKEEYAKSTDENYTTPNDESKKYWYEDIKKRLQTDDEYHPVYASVMCLRRTQMQDMANSLHKLTKSILKDKALAACGITNVNWEKIQRRELQTAYNIELCDKVEKQRLATIFKVLAQTEHLRWNASHEILGYVYDAIGKNEIRLRHNNLTDWRNLTDEIQSYDNNIVDLTLGIKIIPEKKYD